MFSLLTDHEKRCNWLSSTHICFRSQILLLEKQVLLLGCQASKLNSSDDRQPLHVQMGFMRCEMHAKVGQSSHHQKAFLAFPFSIINFVFCLWFIHCVIKNMIAIMMVGLLHQSKLHNLHAIYDLL